MEICVQISYLNLNVSMPKPRRPGIINLFLWAREVENEGSNI